MGGATRYWVYGCRGALRLAGHRRAVRARRRRAGATAPAEDPPAGNAGSAGRVATVLARYRDWRSQPPVTVVAGPPGSGKTVFLAEVIRRLAGSRSWYVPVPLDDVAGGGGQGQGCEIFFLCGGQFRGPVYGFH